MKNANDSIYLDHAAATPLKKCALEAMRPYFSERFFNPSSPYLPAQAVRDEYRAAKDELAHTIGAKGINLVITSGATEANNLAFTVLDPDDDCLILATEHDSIRRLAKNHYKNASSAHDYEISVDKNGLINLSDLERKITPKTKLVSVSIVNNELGTIQPLNKITTILNAERARRRATKNPTPLFLHTDASQALSLLDLSVRRLGVDLITVSSAKLGGPKGVGALYASSEVRLAPLIFGGGQENDLRSGTENVPGVIGFASAASDAKKHLSSSRKRYATYKQLFKRKLLENLDNSEIEPLFLGSEKNQLANFCPVSFPGLDAERLIFMLESRGVYVSTGAACAASKGEKSHVLRACGFSDDIIAGSLRIVFGPANYDLQNTAEKIDTSQIVAAAEKIADVVREEQERLSRA